MSLSEPISSAQQGVIRAQQLFWSALKERDPRHFEQVLADDFVARSPGQLNQSRAAFIATLTSFPAMVLSAGSDNLEVQIFGDIAVLTGVQAARIRLPGGAEITNTIAITNIFRATAGTWMMVLSHAVELPAGT